LLTNEIRLTGAEASPSASVQLSTSRVLPTPTHKLGLAHL